MRSGDSDTGSDEKGGGMRRGDSDTGSDMRRVGCEVWGF